MINAKNAPICQDILFNTVQSIRLKMVLSQGFIWVLICGFKKHLLRFCVDLGCTDVAPEASHHRPTWWNAAMREGRPWPRLPCGFFFFFLFTDSHRCGWDSTRFSLIRADSSYIGQNQRNRQNGRFKPKRLIQAEIQTLSLTPSLVSLLYALCGVRVLSFTESLSASLSLLSVLASPQQHNTNATLLARDKVLQYKKTLITPKCPLLCILLDPLVASKVMWLFWSFYLDEDMLVEMGTVHDLIWHD